MAEDARRDFLERMGEAYAARHGPGQVERHVRLAGELEAAHPARVAVEPAPDGRLDVTVVALDFFSAFAILCGVLAARGLEIESGSASTSAAREAEPAPKPRQPSGRRSRGPRAAVPAVRTIVDEFRVRPGARTDGGDAGALARQLEDDLLELLALVGEGRTDEARDRLDRRLAERFSGLEPPAGALAPLRIDFDNAADPRFTRMEVRGPDTPAFLYALATALALRNLYIQHVEIASVAREARDVFLIASRDGRKLEDAQELSRLRVAVALIKQFAHLLPLAPDPARALRSFGQLVDRVLDETDASPAPSLHLLATPQGLRELARLLGASAFLWEDFLRLQAEHLLPVLDTWQRRPLRGRAELASDLERRLGGQPFQERRRILNEFKDEEMLLADMRQLVDPDVGTVAFSHAVTDLAEAVVEAALAACRAEAARGQGVTDAGRSGQGPLAVFGLGKFGGREMGYASDIELLFAYTPGPGATSAAEAGRFFEQVVQELTGFIAARQEGIFHVDLRLRPHGAKGPLASPLDALGEYYRPGGDAAAFERQALIKLRQVAGDAALAAEVLAVRDAFVWSDAPWDRANALHLRDRQCRELVPAGRFHVKYSPGALVEVEYAVQYLQLEHGRERPELRSPATLEALDSLCQAGLVGGAERDGLRDGYLFWRRVADALRMVRGNARDLVLPEPDSDELRFLARRLGYAAADWQQAGRAFLADLERHRAFVAAFFTGRFRR